MRILQVARQYYPSIGGIQSAIYNQSLQMQELGHDVKILTLNKSFTRPRNKFLPEETIQGIPVKRIPFIGPHQYAIAPGVLKEVKNHDLIHLHSSDFFLDILARTRTFHQKSIVLTSHGVYFHTPFARSLKEIYFQTFTRINLQRVSEIICVSQHDYKLLNKITPSKKLHLIPNGIDYKKSASLDINNRDSNLLLTVGGLAENKKLDNMLRAFALVKEKKPLTKLVIIGPDRGKLESLKKLCLKLNISDQVTFLGKVKESVLFEYLGKANVWLSSASYEGFGIALLESMAAGCVPVVSPLPAFKSIIKNGKEGFITNFNSPDQASKCILRTLDISSIERRRIALHARNSASQFSWEEIGRKINKVYLKVVGEM